MVSVHTDNSIYSDVPWHSYSAKCMEQQNLSLYHPDGSLLAAFVIESSLQTKCKEPPP